MLLVVVVVVLPLKSVDVQKKRRPVIAHQTVHVEVLMVNVHVNQEKCVLDVLTLLVDVVVVALFQKLVVVVAVVVQLKRKLVIAHQTAHVEMLKEIAHVSQVKCVLVV